jgi:hypothetical protein
VRGDAVRFFLESGAKNCYYIALHSTIFKKINEDDSPMLQVKEHEEKLIKLYRRFKPEVREKILAFMEVQVTSIKHSKKRNGANTLSTGERIIQNLEAYLRGDYIVLTKDNLDEYFAGK